jgi:hypothetical protein
MPLSKAETPVGFLSSKNCEMPSSWKHRIYPKHSSLGMAHNGEALPASTKGLSMLARVDFSAFVNSMDDASLAYLSLLREYASRPLQGKALEYAGLYKAMVSQQAIHEERSRISVIEFT